MKRAGTIIPFIFLSLLLLAGCSKPPQYDKAHIGMSLEKLKSDYSDLQRLDDAKDKDGATVLVFRRSSGDTVKKAEYYIRDDKLFGMIFLFPKETGFDAILKDLEARNGKPDDQTSAMGSRAATWNKGGGFISLVSGTSGTEIRLPTGKLERLEPGEILLVIGKK